MKKFLIWLIYILLFAGTVAGLVFGIMFARTDKKLQESNNPAIIEEYKNEIKDLNLKFDEVKNQLNMVVEINKKHEDTIKNLNLSIEQKDTDISNLKSEKNDLENSVNEKQIKINELDNKIKDLEIDKESNLSEIETLTNEKNQLQNEKENLQQSLSEKESKILVLENEKISMQNEISDLEKASLESQELIKTLNTQILTLQNEVKRLQDLIAGYGDIANSTYTVDFYLQLSNGDTLYETKVVKNGQMIKDLISPEETNEYKFDFWTLDRENEINPLNCPITDNTVFYGVVIPKYKVEFINEEIIDTQYILKNDSPIPPTVNKDNFIFVGWAKENSTEILDMFNIHITENTTFVAKFEGYQSIFSKSLFLTVEENPNGISPKEEGVFEVEVAGLKVGDNFKVQLDGPRVCTTPTNNWLNLSYYEVYASSKGSSSYILTSNGSYTYLFYLTNGQSKTFTGKIRDVNVSINISVSCVEDGKLLVMYSTSPETVEGSKYNYDFEYLKFYSIHVKNIEVKQIV